MREDLRAAYEAMVKEGKRLGLPEAYTDDLYKHDRRQLSSNVAPAKFGWVLRTNGTFFLYPHPAGDYDALRWLKHLDKVFEGCHFYWWDGSELLSVTTETLARLLNGKSGYCDDEGY